MRARSRAVAGVDGNGQVRAGRSPRAARAGRPRDPFGSPALRAGDAMAVIPQDRDLDGLILDMPLWENLLLAEPIRARMTRIADGSMFRRAIELCREALDRISHPRNAAPRPRPSSLSGGNRQRFEVARAMTQKPRVIVAHNVTRGLDLAATAEVHRHPAEVRGRRRRGAAHLQRPRRAACDCDSTLRHQPRKNSRDRAARSFARKTWPADGRALERLSDVDGAGKARRRDRSRDRAHLAGAAGAGSLSGRSLRRAVARALSETGSHLPIRW